VLFVWILDSEMWGVPGGSETAVGSYTSTFYAEAAKAVKEVDVSLRVGGPAAADPVILASFIKQAEALHLPLDFVSYHQYGNPRQCGAGWTSGYASGSAGAVSKKGYYWDPHCFRRLFDWARRQVPEKYPVTISFLHACLLFAWLRQSNANSFLSAPTDARTAAHRSM
jgi:xylan 1,4-beta-xylosidase